jgi:hypothetical protein
MGSDGWVIPISLGSGEGEMGFGAQVGIIGKALVGLEIVAQKLQTGLANLANEGANSFSILAKASSQQVKGIVNNLNKGYETAGHLQTGVANLANEGSNSLSQLAKASSKQMNGFANNMQKGEEAVNDLKSAISSLKSKTVTVSVKVSGGGIANAKGGIYSFAEGGAVSAQGGLTTVHQPTHFIYGDNPGNTETLAFIPHNNPGPIMDRLEKMFSRSSNDGVAVAQNVTLNISGNEIINDVKLSKRIMMTVGDKRERFL